MTELDEVQKRLLIQVEEASYSFHSHDGTYMANVGYLQGVGDCCVLAGVNNDLIQNAKIRGNLRADSRDL